MDKIIVNIYVPILGRSFDVFIPGDMPISGVLELVKKAVFELSEGQFLPDETTLLCRRTDGFILDINKSAFELEVRNGSSLMLI